MFLWILFCTFHVSDFTNDQTMQDRGCVQQFIIVKEICWTMHWMLYVNASLTGHIYVAFYLSLDLKKKYTELNDRNGYGNAKWLYAHIHTDHVIIIILKRGEGNFIFTFYSKNRRLLIAVLIMFLLLFF